MKNLYLAVSLLTITFAAIAQSNTQKFESAISSAKTSFGNNQLLEAHASMLLALQDLEMTMCKKVLALLPEKLNGMPRQTDISEIRGLAGSMGNTIERYYNGEDPSSARITITMNSLMVVAFGKMTTDMTASGAADDRKMVEIKGYKGNLRKEKITENVFGYVLSIQMGTSIIEFQMKNVNEEQMLKHANELKLKELGEWLE